MLPKLIFSLVLVPFVALTAPPAPRDGEPLLTLMALGSLRAPVGSDVTLNCSFSIYPSIDLGQLTVSWAKDGALKFFQNSTHMHPDPTEPRVGQLKPGVVSLMLRDLTLRDAGRYTCYVQHGALRATRAVTLRLLDTDTGKRAAAGTCRGVSAKG
ncbi:hypothetical protein XENTR_v10022997 [Xenopus tropicalis]|nr:hypothetical protein XENTR_v10022997 [Xenopus tropicalis]